jgi:hypothetical protein
VDDGDTYIYTHIYINIYYRCNIYVGVGVYIYIHTTAHMCIYYIRNAYR